MHMQLLAIVPIRATGVSYTSGGTLYIRAPITAPPDQLYRVQSAQIVLTAAAGGVNRTLQLIVTDDQYVASVWEPLTLGGIAPGATKRVCVGSVAPAAGAGSDAYVQLPSGGVIIPPRYSLYTWIAGGAGAGDKLLVDAMIEVYA